MNNVPEHPLTFQIIKYLYIFNKWLYTMIY